MSVSPNLKLPYIDANQNQKSVTHNAALTILDALVNCQVQSATLAAPPASPGDGQCWIVASGGSGAWAGKDGNIAAWQDGVWSFYAPTTGMLAYNDATGSPIVWTGSAWAQLTSGGGSGGAVSSVAGRTGAVTLAVADVSGAAPLASPALTGTPTAPTQTAGDNSTKLATTGFVAASFLPASNAPALGIGTAADSSNPLSTKLNSALFTALPTTATPAGTGNVRLTLSKQAAGNTASFLFQDNFSGRAEVGLTGDDNFHFKVSADGSTFYDAIVVTAAGGGVVFLGTPTHPTPATADSSTKSATTAYVQAQGYVTASGAAAAAPVQSVAGRTGAVTLAVADVSGAAPLASPALTGAPTAPTQTAADNSTKLATTAFVQGQGYVTGSGAAAAAPVQSVAGRTGAVTLAVTDVSGAAPLASPAFSGAPTTPNLTAGDTSNKVPNAAFVSGAVAALTARRQISDAAATIAAADRAVAITALTAARTLTLPAASAYPGGAVLTIVDESGACSGTNTITIAAAGTDTINGAASVVLSAPYGYLALESNTSNKWTIIDRPGAASGANTDITSLGGLTTPLSTAQGGTGSTSGASTQITPTTSSSGGSGAALAGTALRYRLIGKLLVFSAAGTLNYTTAPSSVSFTLPAGASAAYPTPCSAFNLSTLAPLGCLVNGTTVTVYNPATASGQAIYISACFEVS